MKTYQTKPPGFFKLVVATLAGFALTMAFVQGTAFATTASNTTISNTATVNYDDSLGNPQAAVNASVDVTVNLVEATPTVSAPLDQSTFSGTAIDYTYTITTNANGVDVYTLTDSQQAADAGITGNTREIRDTAGGGGSIIGSVTLGASSVATAALAGATAITVPADGASDASVNGIASGDTVVIGGTTYTVASITDNATGTSTINLSVGLSAGVAVGNLIAEQQTFYLRVTPTSTVDGDTVTNRITADDGVSAVATDDTITTVNIAPNLTVTKFVRNVDCAACNPAGGTGTTINGQEYWDTGSGLTVTGNPGNTMEYVIAVANGGTAGTATNVVIRDPIPQFTTYVAASMAVDPDGVSGWTTLNDGANDAADPGEYDSSAGTGGTVYIYAGSGGDDGTVAATFNDGTGGSLPGGTTSYGLFQVTIDN